MDLQITPAILTADLTEAKALAEKYIEIGTNQIDIDVADASFGDVTITLAQAAELILEINAKYELTVLFWGLDIAVENASVQLKPILEQFKAAAIQPRIYLDTKCGAEEYIWLIDQPVYKGLVVESDVNITMQYPWHEFDEVQLMTVKQRTQGAPFNPNLLSKALKLKEKGFEGLISVDGGINLETADIIADYIREELIGRISVGSYFQKAADMAVNRDKLVLALAL